MDARPVFMVPMVAMVAQRRITRKPVRTHAAGPFGTATKLLAGALLTTRGRAMVSPPIRYANENGGWGESLITHNDKWIETQSEWDKNSLSTEFRTSEGTTGQIDRQREGDTVYGSGEFQRGDESLSTRSARNEQGGVVVGETGSGERGMIGRTDEGDLYAGKDGNVYRRDESGWQQNSGDGWSNVDVPDERAAQMDQARSNASSKRESLSQSIPADRQAQSQLGTGGFADSYGSARSADGWSNRTYDSTRNRSSYDGSRSNELDRSHNARSSGYQRYNNRSSAGAGSFNRSRGSRPAAGGRRR